MMMMIFAVIWLVLGLLGRRAYINDMLMTNNFNKETMSTANLYALTGAGVFLAAFAISLHCGVNLFTWKPDNDNKAL